MKHVLLITALTILPATAVLAGPDEIEEIETVEEVEVVPAIQEMGLTTIAGRMHPAVVHLPIGWLVMLLLIDLGTFVGKRQGWTTWGLYVLVATVASLVPALVTGLLRASEVARAEGMQQLVSTHRTLILVVAGLLVAAMTLRLVRRNRLTGASGFAYLGLVVAATLVVILAGHIGGKMVHGETYLPF